MRELQADSTRIIVAPIPDGTKGSRHERERQAVASIMRAVLGPETVLSHDAHGAPSVNVPDVHISVSHSTLSAVVAFDYTRPIGIDIEKLRPQLQRVAERFLTSSERAWISSDIDLLRAWTAKEAAFKVTGNPNLMLADFEITSDMKVIVCLPSCLQFGITYLPFDTELIALATRF